MGGARAGLMFNYITAPANGESIATEHDLKKRLVS